ncbi:MAG: HDOD domain-containing protein [Desulfobulbaceae bacterium]|nr:HDOD domain-containing protein [Desulfobulbaceae bacterium]
MSDLPFGKEQHFKKLQNHIDKMPSLSTTVTKVLEVCNKPNTAPNDLNKVISLDPVLTGQVLKLINSAYYSLPNHITSLTRAIIMLGINTVKNLALSTAILGSFGRDDSSPILPMDQFWTHSISVGVTAKTLAARKGVPAANREEYFVGGLLHDLGKIPLSNCFPDEYSQVVELAALEQSPLRNAETVVLGFDHGVVGKLIAEKWKLNDNITQTLCFHHEPSEAAQENRPLAYMVALANVYANLYDFGSAGDPYPEGPATAFLLKALNISWKDMAAIRSTVSAEVEKAQIFLKVSQEAQGV